jgi:hypothetical protein
MTQQLIEANSAFVMILIAHLAGDFLFQNDSHQDKNKCSYTCSAHVGIYTMFVTPIAAIAGIGAAPTALILIQHWLQDRYELHRKWMMFYRQTPPDRWPAGPLFVDQAWHLVFIWLVCVFNFLT